MRIWITLLCSLISIFSFADKVEDDLILSTPDQVAALRTSSDSLIGGVVSPLSGTPYLKQIDLMVRGAERLILSRSYISQYMPTEFWHDKHHTREEWDKYFFYEHLFKNYQGWQFLPHLRLQTSPRLREFLVTDADGITLKFHVSHEKTTLLSPLSAISNSGGGVPSGKYDPRNTHIAIEENGTRIKIYAPNGSSRLYKASSSKRFPVATCFYLLEKEILPNGRVIRYHYNNGNELTLLESLDPTEKYVYASIHVEGIPHRGHCRFTSSSGINVDYRYNVYGLNIQTKDNKGNKATYNFLSPPRLTHASSPFFREETSHHTDHFLLSSYKGQKAAYAFKYARINNGCPAHFRVKTLQLPVGPNDDFCDLYEMEYDPPSAGKKEGSTAAKNSDGSSTVYHWYSNLLMKSIQYYGLDGVLKKEKRLFWTENQWLRSVEILDGKGQLFFKTSFEYDVFGNPICETFKGDLTGNGGEESYVIKRTFSQDGRHLLLKEENPEGKTVLFSYLPNTNLLTTKFTKDHDVVFLREFFEYDAHFNLLQKIIDDGNSHDKNDLSGVTQRTTTNYHLRQQAPFLHMPEWIVETYSENGVNRLLKKSHLLYDHHGNVAHEKVYDAEGKHAYTISKTYNERGDVLTETNPLGQEASYTYDVKGHPETGVNFSHRLQKIFSYDAQGRLRYQKEIGADGTIHSHNYVYDINDNLVQKTDAFDNPFYYTYEPLINQVVQTDFPVIASIDGTPLPVTTSATYDALGRVLSKTDPNGNTTFYRYNAYGEPTQILYPNGGIELFRYAKNGKLISHTGLDGLTIHYKHDVLDRVLSKTYSNATPIAEELFTYNSFLLLSETDKEGNIKCYTYDGAGRKVREEMCGRVTDFRYDALGRVASIRKNNGNNTLEIHYKRDLEGKVLEEKKTDTLENVLYKISYSYDSDGNQETIIRYINEKEAVETFTYDAFSRCTQRQDAEGYITKTAYNEQFLNHLGQRVLQKVTVDPLHITTMETRDALARITKVDILNADDRMISSREMTYDKQGNLLYRKDHVYEGDRFQNTQTIKYTYTCDHQVESLTRAFGTKDARTTTYTYLPSGKMATKRLPDGVTLAYSYHPLGFISQLESSDGKIHHSFEYNRLGHLEYASDKEQNIAIRRQVDPFGNVLQEKLPKKLEIKKEYDHLDRLTSLKMRDQGEVVYTYDPLFLRQVTRVSNEGKELYSHTYKQYDLDGNLVTESLIGDLGQAVHLTDLRGKKASISSSYFSQECAYDPVGNLITHVAEGVEHQYSYDGLSQLSSENSQSHSLGYVHDSLHNRTRKNRENNEINDLNELLSTGDIRYTYDLNGNQTLKHSPSETSRFTYDSLNRLIEIASEKKKVNFIYDPLGRRLSKTVYIPLTHGWKETTHENYLYQDENEIGGFSSQGRPNSLRVLGLSKHKNSPNTVGVELDGQVFATALDVQGNIRRLIDPDTQMVASSYEFTAFGEELEGDLKKNTLSPWRFASKRIDPEFGLIYFGKRYYDPRFGRWVTTDPLGFIDSSNLYQYVFNNPFRYSDPDGRFVVVVPLLALTWKVLAVAAVTAYVSYELEHQHHHSNSALARSFNSAAHQVVQSIGGVSQYVLNQKLSMEKKQIDERLPSNPDELLEDSNWEETSHPEAKERGHRTFENKKTGEIIRHDAGKPGTTGHKAQDHWHRHNPNSKGDLDKYLDAEGNAVSDGHPDSHLYPR